MKNLLDLDVTFSYGDFIPYLCENDEIVDFILASGRSTSGATPTQCTATSTGRGGRNRRSAAGSPPHSYWTHRGDILVSLEKRGFSDIEVGFGEPDRDHGPAFAAVAQR